MNLNSTYPLDFISLILFSLFISFNKFVSLSSPFLLSPSFSFNLLLLCWQLITSFSLLLSSTHLVSSLTFSRSSVFLTFPLVSFLFSFLFTSSHLSSLLIRFLSFSFRLLPLLSVFSSPPLTLHLLSLTSRLLSPSLLPPYLVPARFSAPPSRARRPVLCRPTPLL